jgi:hypothetical protein
LLVDDLRSHEIRRATQRSVRLIVDDLTESFAAAEIYYVKV